MLQPVAAQVQSQKLRREGGGRGGGREGEREGEREGRRERNKDRGSVGAIHKEPLHTGTYIQCLHVHMLTRAAYLRAVGAHQLQNSGDKFSVVHGAPHPTLLQVCVQFREHT